MEESSTSREQPSGRAMSVAEAARLLRAGGLDGWKEEQAEAVLEVMERNPGLHVIVGDEAAVVAARKQLEARLRPVAAGAEDPLDPVDRGVRNRWAVAGLVAGLGLGLLVPMLHERSRVRSVSMESKVVPPADNFSGADSAALSAALPVGNSGKPPVSKGPPPQPSPVSGAVPEVAAVAEPVPVLPVPAVGAAAARDEAVPFLEVRGGAAELVSEGNGVWRVTDLNGRAHVTLSGKAKRIAFGEINGEVEIETRALEVEAIEMRGAINGSGQVRLASPGAAVEFRGSVGGSVKLSVDVGEGRVTFLDDGVFMAPVIGGAEARIRARRVDFAAGMDGGSRAEVMLVPRGSVGWSVLDGGARLRWRREHPGDPEPEVRAGTLQGGGTAEEVR